MRRTPQLLARSEDLRPAPSVDGPVDPAAAEQGGVGGVDDRVDPLGRDVALGEPDPHHGEPGTVSAVSVDDLNRVLLLGTLVLLVAVPEPAAIVALSVSSFGLIHWIGRRRQRGAAAQAAQA